MKFLMSNTKTENKNFNLKIYLEKTETPQPPQEMYGFDTKLNYYRNFIDNIKSEDWKKIRWYINDYDFLVKDPIINRAFYKYWEIINEFGMFLNYKDGDLMLHCAEAPGGFIQGTNLFLRIGPGHECERHGRQQNKISQPDEDGFVTIVKRKRPPKHDYRIYSISLNKDLPKYKSYNLPSYNKNIVNKHVCITYGKDNTGDITHHQNIQHILDLSKRHFYLITADGGFDEGSDFNHKEQLHYSLILNEILSAIWLQKRGGHFVLKIFDMFTETSIHLMYLLNLCWEEVWIYKPMTSRPTNSEKYVICKGFKIDESQRTHLVYSLKQLSKTIKDYRTKFVAFKLFNDIPEDFIQKIKKTNQELLESQSCFLEKAVQLCQDNEFLANYESLLIDSLEQRKETFKRWESRYNLDAFV
jgi:23S rRNA U2552 (ribose-2'-O)-methylase RlmE/FtsJ